MWIKKPNALQDGLVAASVASLVLSAILIAKGTSSAEQQIVPQCQEVVAVIEQKGDVLAQCPANTYVEIVEDNVVCRCGRRPAAFERDRNPPLVIPPPNRTIPNAEPFLLDDKSITL